jgi:hypothetical protein
MLALFIGLILLYGMNKVFSDTATAIRAGQTLGEVTRNGRAVQPILFNDLNNCAADSPAFIISSSLTAQNLNLADYTASPVAGTSYATATGCLLGDHLHRTDMLMFFARGLFKRKTADQGFITSTTSSDEAYIHYGHLRISTDGINYYGPDDPPTATGGPFASDWVLGRNVILLVDPNYIEPNTRDFNTTPQHEAFYTVPSSLPPALNYPLLKVPPPTGSVSAVVAVPTAVNLAPLSWNSPDYVPGTTPTGNITQVQSSRYDLAGTTIDQFRTTITNAAIAQATEGTPTPFYTWWNLLVYRTGFESSNLSILSNQIQTTEPNQLKYRFQASNVLSPTPLSSQDQANLAPYMLEHVSQMIVEYAGDYVSQDTAGGIANVGGDVTDTVPDGQIDWVYATKGDWNPNLSYSVGDYVIYNNMYWQAVTPQPGAANAPSTSTGWVSATPPKAIRWYGMPRDSTGSGVVYSGSVANINANELNNVVPLSDIWKLATNPTAVRPVPYETEVPTASPAITDYASTAGNSVLGPSARYTAVWRNDVPAMVRILIKVDDPAGVLQDGPWFEYVFKLK